MKKKVIGMVFGLGAVLGLAGCNRQIIDMTYNFDKAMVYLPDGTVVSGEVQSWKDFDDGDQIQVKINGVTYSTHSSNVVMFNE